ncbi:MAG: ArsR/SmtB family transcription factor [Eubacteriales bacterium]
MVKLFKALGDENRLRILNLLMNNELCVCEIEVILEMTQSNVSRHLSKLKSVGLIDSLKKAQWVHYKASQEFVNEDLLFEYLNKNFKTKDLFVNDLKRYSKYKENNIDCQLIAKNKDKVLEAIK